MMDDLAGAQDCGHSFLGKVCRVDLISGQIEEKRGLDALKQPTSSSPAQSMHRSPAMGLSRSGVMGNPAWFLGMSALEYSSLVIPMFILI